MTKRPFHSHSAEEIQRQAATWVWRCDGGLTASEQDDFSAWLAADPRHGQEMARHRQHWKRLDLLADWRPEHSAKPNPDLLAPPLRHRWRRVAYPLLALAAAAAIAVAFFDFGRVARKDQRSASVVAANSPDESRRLPDGSVVELNRGAVIEVDFQGGKRRVWLKQGEAHFTVAKDSAHPFVVTAHGVDVRAVGTAFNVRLDSGVVEVLVTEGRVQVRRPEVGTQPDSATDESPLAEGPPPLISSLVARQRAVVSFSEEAAAPQIATLTDGEIERVLAWQRLGLDFTDRPLAEIVAEFNRRNVVQLVVSDPELASVRISARLRANNIDGFVRLLETGFGVRVERRSTNQIYLLKETSAPKN